MSKKSVAVGLLLFAAGGGIGYGVGYFLTKRRMEAYIDNEIAEFKEHYARPRYGSPEEAVAALISETELAEVRAVVNESGYTVVGPDADPEAEKVTVRNLWDDVREGRMVNGEIVEEDGFFSHVDEGAIGQGEPEPEEEEETPQEDESLDELEFIEKRNPDHPYVISYNTFMGDDPRYYDNKLSLTYFEEDGYLIDEKDHNVPNIEDTVGLDNMQKFGIGSNDPLAVYIRNEKLDADFEVILDKRSYEKVVLNVPQERVRKNPLKMRDDDD